MTKLKKVKWGRVPSCPQGLGLNGPIGPFKPSDEYFEEDIKVESEDVKEEVSLERDAASIKEYFEEEDIKVEKDDVTNEASLE